jgi:hypothetical protein
MVVMMNGETVNRRVSYFEFLNEKIGPGPRDF